MTRKRFNLTYVAGAAALAACGSIPAAATPGSGFAPNGIVNGHFGTINENTTSEKTGKWGYHLKTLAATDMGVDRLVVQPGGYSGWHTHPGPVFVTVLSGSIKWYDGSNPMCPPRTYNAGDSFIEQPYKVHNAENASLVDGAEFVAITIKPDGFVGPAFRIDRTKPGGCP